VELERGRMHQMEHGYDSGNKTPMQAVAYVAFQELATRISHRNTGRYTQDPIAEKLLARVAADENLHMIFYRNLVGAALEIDPSRTVQAIRDEVIGFQMPGTGIRGFDYKAKQIAKAGIYDLRIHHDDVLSPLLRHWKFFELTGLDADGEKARDEVKEFLVVLDGMARGYEDRRAAAAAKAAAAGTTAAATATAAATTASMS
jgi:acyl-[acyl-carrier-protein] desaturase